jgi:hypothetical protein
VELEVLRFPQRFQLAQQQNGIQIPYLQLPHFSLDQFLQHHHFQVQFSILFQRSFLDVKVSKGKKCMSITTLVQY